MTKVRLACVGLAATALLLVEALPALGRAEAATAVSVTASEFGFQLSKRTAKRGTVVFTVVNDGQVAHDFRIAGKKTAQIAPGATAKLSVRLAKPGRYAFTCTIAGHAASGMKGTFTIRR